MRGDMPGCESTTYVHCFTNVSRSDSQATGWPARPEPTSGSSSISGIARQTAARLASVIRGAVRRDGIKELWPSEEGADTLAPPLARCNCPRRQGWRISQPDCREEKTKTESALVDMGGAPNAR